ncbi:MAG: PHP domain-containing protein [Cyanobacteria bacterium P01_A01_bin.83]
MVATYSLKPIAQDTIYLKSIWETINYTSCPKWYNFHLHTIASDGQMKPFDLIQQAISLGLRGLAITDHHSVAGYQQAEQFLQTIKNENQQLELPHLWTGMEITAKLLEVEVHILGYGFDPQHEALGLYLQGEKPQGKNAEAKQVIDSIHRAGGLAVLAHPERYRRSAEQLIPPIAELGIDGVETYYAYNNPPVWQPSPDKTETVAALAAKYNLLSTCGTDSHGLSILRRI